MFFGDPSGVIERYGEYHTYPVGSMDSKDDTEGASKIYSTFPSPQEIFDRATVGLSNLVSPHILNIIDDPMYMQSILSSTISAFEMTHSTSLSPRYCTESIDNTYIQRHKNNYMYNITRYWPVTHIESFSWVYAHGETTEPTYQFQIPPRWVALKDNTIQVIPDFGFMSMYFGMTGSGTPMNQRLPIMNINNNMIQPKSWVVKYKYGFEDGRLPSALVELIVLQCIVAILEEMAAILLPTNSVTTSIDSVSQSASTPGHDLLLKKAELLRKRAKEMEKAVFSGHSTSIAIDFIGL